MEETKIGSFFQCFFFSDSARTIFLSSLCFLRRLRRPSLPSKRGDNFRTAHFRGGHTAKAGVQ